VTGLVLADPISAGLALVAIVGVVWLWRVAIRRLDE
jgi:hypothetical protein